jgi:3-phosphoshikimate 1-carboxyvinyltransferase
MNYHISHRSKTLKGEVKLTSSKSESNRALIIQALCHEHFEIENLSSSDDTILLKNAIAKSKYITHSEKTYYTGDGGTTTRFLIAYLSTCSGTHVVQASPRMQQRPITILVDALRTLGANITYLQNEGQTPIQIIGNKQMRGGELWLNGNVSSQFVTALLLIATKLKNGLVIHFEGEVVSRPYINMTLKMLQEFRVYGQWHNNSISISQQMYHIKSDVGYKYIVEADWSSASYWYAMVALSKQSELHINGLMPNGKQGDSLVYQLFELLGVHSTFTESGVLLTKAKSKHTYLGFDCSETPDLAQTIAVTCAAANIDLMLTGVSTLQHKETNRSEALKNELYKLGVSLHLIGTNCFELSGGINFENEIQISTYQDHRMALSFAVLAILLPSIIIENAEVVSKSYPEFWDDMRALGFIIEQVKN